LNRSHLVYIPFSDFNKQWKVMLQENEQVVCLAAGTEWACALTDFNYLRLFTSQGVQKELISFSAPVLTMVGYENLLGVVYH